VKNITDPKVAIVLNARNEEKILADTISSILSQDLSPYRIIVINDGSSDKTGEIAANFSQVEVIHRKKRNESYLGRKELADTINAGLRKLHNDHDCDFVCMLGADILLPKNYLRTIIDRMKQNKKIAIASGTIEGEFSIEPRGGGRVVRCDFWRKLGFLYPVNYGWEGYLVYKAQSMGYEVVAYPDVVYYTQRKTGSKFNPKIYYYYGMAMKALGYAFIYSIAKTILFAKKNPRASYYTLRGFLSSNTELYEPELRDYIHKTQIKNIFNSKIFTRFYKILKS